MAMQRKAHDTNQNIGKSVKKLNDDMSSIVNNGVWYIWS